MKNEAELTIVNSGANTPSQGPPPRKISVAKRPTVVAPSKPNKVLPSERIASEKHLDVLRAFAAASGPGNNMVTTEEVAKIVDMAPSTVGLLNPFFCDTGLIQRLEAGKFLPSQEVLNFAKAWNWNQETAAHKLAPLIIKTWFADPLMRLLSFQPIEEKQAIAELAEKASASPEYADQLHLLLDYMRAAGLVQIENGMVRAAKQTSPINSTPSDHEQTHHGQAAKETVAIKSTISTAFSQAAQGVVNFHVDVKINMDEFARWSPDRISAFFSGIAQVLAAKGAIEKEGSKEN
jgi:hypothetical protein